MRDYQRRIYQESMNSNALVVLPTGSGKTRIASQHIKRLQGGKLKVLFLVPTCLLVDQQAQALREDTGSEVTANYGGSTTPQTSAHVLVSTPAAFLSLANKSASHFGLGCFALVVFDEVHHVIKRHPYRKVARLLQGMHAAKQGHVPQILRAEEEELRDGDYHASQVPAQLYADQQDSAASDADIDNDMDVDMDRIMPTAGTEPQPLPGRVHEAIQDFLSAIKSGSPALHPLSAALMQAVRATESAAAAHDPSFVSPVGRPGKQGKVAAWGQCAHDKHKKALQESQTGKGRSSASAAATAAVYLRLHHLYEALRLTVSSRQTSLELAMRYLEMMEVLRPAPTSTDVSSQEDDGEDWGMGGGSAGRVAGVGILQLGCRDATASTSGAAGSATAADTLACEAVAELEEVWHSYSPLLLRLRRLSDVLLQQRDRFAERLRVIVFVQQRLSTHVLQHYLSTRSGLSDLVSEVVYATASPATPMLSVSPAQSLQRIARFSSGEVQLLLSTAVAEEGMDIAQANCVVRFDAIQTPVSLVQSRGRARQEDSAFVVMCEQPGRGVAQLVRAEGQQRDVLRAMAAEQGASKDAHTVAEVARKKACAQASRSLAGRTAAASALEAGRSAVQALNLYAQKSGGEVEEEYAAPGSAAAGEGWHCTMRFMPHPDLLAGGGGGGDGGGSNARILTACGTARSKKDAREAAASVLVRDCTHTGST
ncbi:MAG: hypothetical protein WDW38_003459 [Sanguina aurantia]